MKRHFQCAEQLKSPFKVTKYCACHEILSSRFQRQIPEVLPQKTIRTHSEHLPNTSEHKIVISHLPLRRPYSSDLGDNFVLKNTTFRAPAISQNVTKCCACHEKSQSHLHQILRLPQKLTLHLHHLLRMPRKMHSTLLYASILLASIL